MLLPASLALRDITSEEDDDSMKVMTRQTADPVVRVIGTGGTEDFCAGGHALAELFREGGERSFVDSERAQAIPGETYGDPSYAGILGRDGFCGSYFLDKSLEPLAP
jgi:hypothetical protein